MIVNAIAFAKKTGYPIAMIRAYCREGKLSHWQRGRVYLLDDNEALAEMKKLKSTIVYKPQKNKMNGVTSHSALKAKSSGRFDYRKTIRDMQLESKKAIK